ncbi:MAG TPA: GTP 3',8-cyclase MoaA [Eubacteriaceae bacterium]|jgi:cyclic pyranopterin phosphate synthase|nr:GTP 3',8-cyclase MoaA [Eubacteriaceae bacterium]
MKDKWTRDINYLRISITDRCNLRCFYCMPEEGIQKLNHDDILTFEQLYPIVEVAVELGISKIRITGGEPLVRKGIVNFIEKISKLSGLKDIAMTTNGILLERYAQELKEAGLHRLNISLDTLKEDRYKMITRWGELNQVLRGIEATEKAGLSPIKINVVAMRGINDDEIEDFARLTKEKPYHVRFIELMPMGEAEEIEGERFITNEEILNRLPDLIPLINEDGSGPAKYYKLPNSKGSIGFISPMSNHFCKSCNRIRLTADGKIKPCLHSNFEIDLKLAKTKEEIRNILQKGILLKPERHYLKEGSESSIRGMNQIGG